MKICGNVSQTIIASNKNVGQSAKFNKNDVNKSSDLSFTGMRAPFQRRIYASPELLQAVVGIAVKQNKPALDGTLPKEMIKVLRNKTINPVEITKQIKSVLSSFSSAGTVLKELELETAKKTKTLYKDEAFIKKYMDESFELLKNGDKNLTEIMKMQKEIFFPSKEFMTKLQTQASKIIETTMKKTGVIPQNAGVKLKYMDQGLSSTAYNVSFLDETGNKLFHDKVLKVYTDPEISLKTQIRSQIGYLNYHKNMTQEEYIEKTKIIIDKVPKVPEVAKNIMKASLGEKYEQIKKMSEKQIKKDFTDLRKQYFPSNGIEAEANAAAFIKKAIGHKLEKSNIIEYHFFDQEGKIALSEMSDDSLPAVTKKTDFGKMGIFHDDITINLNNTVAGRIVDLGSIVVENKTLAENPAARRIYKKISALKSKSPERTEQMRLALWMKYYKLAKTNKIAQSKDVLKGLKEAKSLIY